MLRRVADWVVVREYMATFTHTQEAARRVLMPLVPRRGGRGWGVHAQRAAWYALNLGQWEPADDLASPSREGAATARGRGRGLALAA